MCNLAARLIICAFYVLEEKKNLSNLYKEIKLLRRKQLSVVCTLPRPTWEYFMEIFRRLPDLQRKTSSLVIALFFL